MIKYAFWFRLDVEPFCVKCRRVNNFLAVQNLRMALEKANILQKTESFSEN